MRLGSLRYPFLVIAWGGARSALKLPLCFYRFCNNGSGFLNRPGVGINAYGPSPAALEGKKSRIIIGMRGAF